MTIAQAHQYGLRHATHRWKAESKPDHLVFIVCANFEPWRNDLVRTSDLCLLFSMAVGADGRGPNQEGDKVEPNQIGESPP